MGTNYYVNNNGEEGQHIGKRSAAGPYCWNCGITLCKGGEGNVHYTEHGKHYSSIFGTTTNGGSHCITCSRSIMTEWFDKCPICGKEPRKEGLDDSSGGKELGFNKKPLAREGVSSCSSFSWAIIPYDFFTSHEGTLELTKPIIDEYGETYSIEEFREILKDCPLQYFHSLGTEFC